MIETNIFDYELIQNLLEDAKKEAITKHLAVFPLDTEKFIKVNELEEITNPLFFERNNSPTRDGLLSNEIFGISKEDRTTIFAYIHLGGTEFMHPLLYKTWSRMDPNVNNVICEADNYRFDTERGKFVLDEKGSNGLAFLKETLFKHKLKQSNSDKRNKRIEFIEKYKDKLFIKDLIVIPAGFRDVDTEDKRLKVGEVNQLYTTILRDANALKESDDYGLTMNGSLRYKIQTNIMKIYDWFIFGRDPATGKDNQATGLSRKLGLIRRAGMKKSFDWGSRLVICTQDLRKEKATDVDVGIDEIGVPIAALCANLFPFMIYYIRRYFENNLSDMTTLPTIDLRTKKVVSAVKIQDWRMVYSDDRIKKELDKFMHGMAKRFIPIEAPIDPKYIKDERDLSCLTFKGRMVPDEKAAQDIINGTLSPEAYPMNSRPLTWCDLIYRAAVDVSADKMALVTRFPMDSYWNQFPAKIKVISTIQTEPILVDNIYYPRYPLITLEDINQNSSNRFIDVALPNNVRLDSIGGDFDGDTISVKIPYSVEANEELKQVIDSKKHYVGLGGINRMNTIHEGVQSMYQLTMILDDDKDKITNPTF